MADNLPSADCYYYIKVWQTPYYTIIFLFGKLPIFFLMAYHYWTLFFVFFQKYVLCVIYQ